MMTLRHIVSWKFNGATRAVRDEQAQRVTEALEALPATIEDIRALTVHRNELFDGENYDLTLVADFDDADGLARYAVHPDHLPLVDLLKPITAARAAVDFTV